MLDGGNAQEIIIVKRGGEGEEGHHGGAWKIAFADFMTAMMALFLVLWLINAANEETKRSVASYFNPIKLVERNRSEKGLQENEGGPATGEQTAQSGQANQPTEAADTPPDPLSEQAFFANPAKSLEAIAGPPDMNSFPTVPVADPMSNASGETTDGFIDPLAADYWAPSEVASKQDGKKDSPDSGGMTDQAFQAASETESKDKSEPAGKKTDQPPGEAATDITGQHAEKVEAVSKDISQALEKALGPAAGQIYQLEVKPQDNGVMISLTDQLGFPMFEIGSAVPKQPLVKAMDAISKVLAEETGKIRIFGHTDGRPIRAANDDNWRLSLDRARAAFFMLKRGGMEEARISQITGFADRKLRVPEDPYDDSNRRIELLLEVAQ
ncbi:flagellar motor protein MotB [Zhengella mangrovi]|uniref:Flagellar motor protein MotB n=1 Tax=Zhengella mangrovi TaxID=1982044 RepID=A0A2G1QJM1_9HYPH|nr:MotB family protein [Zhengella mangrovi]PHP65725.1 flagellar motor protein MotB [Zhengella mangrovi]